MVALEAALQFEDTQESMHAFCVGQYLEVSLCACFNMQGCEERLPLYFLLCNDFLPCYTNIST